MGEDRGLGTQEKGGGVGEERTAGGSCKRQGTREAGETPVSPPPRKEDLNGFFTV